MDILLHHADVESVSSKRCFCRIEGNPVGIGCCGFVLYLGRRNAERLSFFCNALIETTGVKPVVFYFNILPHVLLN
jgi:hypothetical protein